MTALLQPAEQCQVAQGHGSGARLRGSAAGAARGRSGALPGWGLPQPQGPDFARPGRRRGARGAARTGRRRMVPGVPPSAYLRRAHSHRHLRSLLITPASAVWARSWGPPGSPPPPWVPLHPLRARKVPRDPCAPCVLRPGFPGTPWSPARGASGGFPHPRPGPALPRAPGGYPSPAPSPAGRERGRRYLGWSAAACPGRRGLRPSGRLRVAVSTPAPGGRRSVYRVWL